MDLNKNNLQSIKVMILEQTAIQDAKIEQNSKDIGQISIMQVYQSNRFDRVDLVLDEHSKKLDEHTKKLDQHSRILDEHTMILNEHTKKLDEHSRILDKHTRILNEHTKTLDRHTQILEEHSLRLANIEQHMATKDDIDKIFKQLDYIVKMFVEFKAATDARFEKHERILQKYF